VIEDTPLGDGKRWVLVAADAAAPTRLLLARAATPDQIARIGDQTGWRVAFFLETDDFRRDFAAMTAKGVRFRRPPRAELYGTVAVFEDLYGNLWDLIEPAGKACDGRTWRIESAACNERRPIEMTTISPALIMQIGMGFWASKTLLSAVELGLFTELAAGPQDLAALSVRLGLHQRSSRDFLDTLVALGLLDRQDGRYGNMPATDFYLDRAKPSYIGGLLEMANNRLYASWGGLTDSLQTGRPQGDAKSTGADPFVALYADAAKLESFLRAMTGVSLPTAHALADAFPWREAASFVDVGCAQGSLTCTIATAHPHLAGIGFDLPPVGPVFERYVAERGLSGRVKFQPGSFFEIPLPQANVIVMGHILHDWDLDQKRMLIAKTYDALPKGGRFIAYDAMIDDDRRQNVFGLLMSLNMLVETPGGFDYTGADCIGWMREAGFADARHQVLDGPNSMVVATK
jgi:SAM-dependent methyltransferase